ncbi:putative carboxylesterase protein [Botrytis fragariae]|uniref:Putative carboxylesterase protein n=1 Tax=Botrytis fragariae TaxID=1964551 RepID=A0A8H6B082_9HELO|nr:putative carboxylesterase protein [Botrytis fragariae]KAF5876784.1 putative carboxylesterase protein [Botrytis fragariae]
MKDITSNWIFLFASLVSSAIGFSGTAIPRVQTTSGVVIGHSARNESDVVEFLGIRYAQATNGSLRFRPPVPFISSDTYKASQYSPACPFNPAPPLPTFPNKSSTFDRIYATATGGTGLEFSEDCLALNIWTSSISPKGLKPVIFFIHGGRFVSGSTNNALYEGHYLAATGDIVVVTIDYRLLVFGFPGSPLLPSANLAILDQRLALEWVKANIASFGGDPSKILMYGQSVGGLSIHYHAFAWPDDPIASSFMSISGTINDEPNSPELSKSYWDKLSVLVGCKSGVEEDVVSCMQEAPYQTILAAIKSLPLTPTEFLPRTQFVPTIDEKIVFSDYATRANAGRFSKLPYLVGNANHESGFYAISAFAQNITFSRSQWDLFDLKTFTCSAAQSALLRLKHNVTVYLYRYFGDFDNTRLYPTSGAYHLSDLNMWHGVGRDVSGISNTRGEERLSKEMMRTLIEFAKDPLSGLEKLGWRKYEGVGSATLNILGQHNSRDVTHVKSGEYDAQCAL